MPHFTPRVLDAVEAYRLPQRGEEPTDGLMFFLTELNLEPDGTRSGNWIVNAADGPLVMTDEEFRRTYKPLEG